MTSAGQGDARSHLVVGDNRVELVLGDITTLEVDAIVNAANDQLAGGGGVDGAIHRAGGSCIMAETRAQHPEGCPTGSAVLTGAGKLPARWVVHAVGPRWRGGASGEEELLRGAYRRSLELAREAGAQSVAFPAISTGVYGYPLAEAARVAVSTVREELSQHSGPAMRVVFCLFGAEALVAFETALAGLATS